MNRIKKFLLMAWQTRRRLTVLCSAGFICLLYTVCVAWPWKPLKFQGYVEGEYVHVASPVAGRLETLAAHRGDSVRAGQALYTLEGDPERQQLAQVKAQLVLAEQNLQRAKELIGSHSISQKEYDQANSEQKALSKSLEQIQWRLDQKAQSAQAAGYVQDTFYVPGEWVPEGKAVVSLLPPENIKVRFFVDAATLPRVTAGQLLLIHAYGTHDEITGRVVYLSSKAEYTPPVIYSNQTRANLTFMIEALPQEQARKNLHPGQPVEVLLK